MPDAPRPIPRRATRRLVRPLLLALLAVGALGACSDSTGPRPPLEGRWISPGLPTAIVPTDATIEMRLDQEGGTVTGTGSMQYPSGFASEVAVTGSVSGSVVMLTFASPALAGQAMTMQALLAEDGDGFGGTLTLGQEPATTRHRTFAR